MCSGVWFGLQINIAGAGVLRYPPRPECIGHRAVRKVKSQRGLGPDIRIDPVTGQPVAAAPRCRARDHRAAVVRAEKPAIGPLGPGIREAMAFYIACALIGAAIIIAIRYRRNHHWPLLDAVNQRNALISEKIGGRDAPSHEARIAFAEAYFEIDGKMMEASHEEVFHLRRAWEEYRETIVDPNADVLHNTVRPENFFFGVGERHRALGWFANIAIAVGLLFTFLGIIAALSTLDLSGGPDAMQSQLNELMQVAGAKFWASVGGIVASIILRSVDYRFAKKVDEGLTRMCDLLEHGMAYLPPQRIAAEQLKQLEEQTPALRGFSEQLAVVLEEALERQFTPMVSSLGSIQDGIDRISGGGGEAVRSGDRWERR